MALQNPTTLLAPTTLAAVAAAGIDPTWWINRQAGLAFAMVDEFDPTLLGLISLRGDFAGKGTRTMRVQSVDGVGYAERLVALGSETARPPSTGWNTGYTTLTIAPYGLGKKETFEESILGDPATRLGLDQLEMMLPKSGMATLRYLGCVTGSGVTANTIGATGVALGMDDIYDLRALIVGTAGAQKRGRVRMTIDGGQLNQLSDSARSEPGIERRFESWIQAAAVNLEGAEDGFYPNFCDMRIDIGTTDDVQQSGGDYLGFGGSPGFIGWGRAATNRLNLAAHVVPVYFPEWGIVMWRPADSTGNLTNEVMIYQIVGTALGDPEVFLQFLVKSVV